MVSGKVERVFGRPQVDSTAAVASQRVFMIRTCQAAPDPATARHVADDIRRMTLVQEQAAYQVRGIAQARCAKKSGSKKRGSAMSRAQHVAMHRATSGEIAFLLFVSNRNYHSDGAYTRLNRW